MSVKGHVEISKQVDKAHEDALAYGSIRPITFSFCQLLYLEISFVFRKQKIGNFDLYFLRVTFYLIIDRRAYHLLSSNFQCKNALESHLVASVLLDFLSWQCSIKRDSNG